MEVLLHAKMQVEQITELVVQELLIKVLQVAMVEKLKPNFVEEVVVEVLLKLEVQQTQVTLIQLVVMV